MSFQEAENYTRNSVYAGQDFYHGTNADQVKGIIEFGFDLQRLQALTYGAGIYLTNDEKVAQIYDLEKGDQPIVIKMRFLAKRPKLFATSLEFWDFVDRSAIRYDDTMPNQISQRLQIQGFDAIELKDLQYFVAFSPNQIAIYQQVRV